MEQKWTRVCHWLQGEEKETQWKTIVFLRKFLQRAPVWLLAISRRARVCTLNTANILDTPRQENFNVLVETGFNVNRRHSLFCIKKIHRCDLLVQSEQRCSPLQKYAAYVFTQCSCSPVISARNLRPIVSLPFSSSVANTPLIRPVFLQRFPVGI